MYFVCPINSINAFVENIYTKHKVHKKSIQMDILNSFFWYVLELNQDSCFKDIIEHEILML